MSAESTQQAFSSIWWSVSGYSKYDEIRTFSMIFAKPGPMADTLLILALPSCRSLWLFPMSILSFSPNWWSHSWASQDLVWPFTLRLLRNAPRASWMTCALHGMGCVNAGHSIREGSRVDCSSRVSEQFEKALSLAILSKWPSVSSKRSSTSFKCLASRAPVCWPWTYYPW